MFVEVQHGGELVIPFRVQERKGGGRNVVLFSVFSNLA